MSITVHELKSVGCQLFEVLDLRCGQPGSQRLKLFWYVIESHHYFRNRNTVTLELHNQCIDGFQNLECFFQQAHKIILCHNGPQMLPDCFLFDCSSNEVTFSND